MHQYSKKTLKKYFSFLSFLNKHTSFRAMTISGAKISELVIVNGIGIVVILYCYGTFSNVIRHLQFQLNGSPKSVDQAEGGEEEEEEEDADSTDAKLPLKGSMNSGDPPKGEDTDSTDAQVSGVQSVIAMSNSQQKVKRLDNTNHSTRVIKNPVHELMPEKRGKIQKAEIRLRAGGGHSRAEDADSADAQINTNRSTLIIKRPGHGIDLMSEIRGKMQKLKDNILAGGGQSSVMW
ncbi:hypothetical protein MtrunA17_Chr5g0416131 [Medicago truncatula]|uniref:Transmembrane protein n=2 Tax=Medicago truncatula TaxID=3880 RepID=A0A396HTM1_MEDTR|nr:uncharacterized protein LOC11414732 isoform X1 [Medicago truncatula]RHN55294.1 hypothetical protein MtrunA17_Chr5g0416131 [Medicago truncatula]